MLRCAQSPDKDRLSRASLQPGILRLVRESAIPTISIIHTLDERLRNPLGGLMENAILLQLLQCNELHYFTFLLDAENLSKFFIE